MPTANETRALAAHGLSACRSQIVSAPGMAAAAVEATRRLGSPYLAAAELNVHPDKIGRDLRKAGLVAPNKRTSRSAERLGGLALYEAGADGGRFDSVDMQAQLTPRRLGLFWRSQIRMLHAHRLAQSDGADCGSFAYCIAAVLNTASRGPVKLPGVGTVTWPGLDADTLRTELAMVGIHLTEREMGRLISEVTSRRTPIGKVELGRRLQLTEVERSHIDARNIQATDHSEAAKLGLRPD